MDVGGLAQMASYNTLNSRNDLGMPASGFTSRRGSSIKSLSFGQTKMTGIQDNPTPTPRTSRSHLLAGLRTAPKNPGNSIPLTAPPTQIEHSVDPNLRYSNDTLYNGPRTSNFSGQQNQYSGQMCNNQSYPMPEHVLAPPDLQVDDNVCDQIDPHYYAQLVATNRYLAEQQQRLQQQLINVQAAAQQFQGMNLAMQQYTTPPITPQSLYQQHLKNNTQASASPNRVSLPAVPCYNSLAGQSAYFQLNQQTGQYEAPQMAYQLSNCVPAQRVAASSRARVSMLPYESPNTSRGVSPPIKPQSPIYDYSSLPPPSAGVFRRGHRKAPSSLTVGSEESSICEGHKISYSSKPMGVSSASLSGFGPGQGRAGEHPVRQPRGPPSIDLLLAKPTTKIEGSKNFASRNRQQVTNGTVRNSVEFRRTQGSTDSGSLSPASDAGEVTFAANDNDSDSGRSGSGSLASRPALGSPRTSIHGAIGSNRPSSRQNRRFLERKSVVSLDSSYTSASVSGDEGISLGENFAAVIKNGKNTADVGEMSKNTPKLILTSADKRKILM